MPAVKRRATSTNTDKIKVNFDVALLDSLLKYIRCEYVSTTNLTMLRRFVTYLNIEAYQYDNAIYPRVKLLDILTQAIVNENIQDENILRSYVQENFPEGIGVIEQVGLSRNQLSSSECDYIAKAVAVRVQTIAIYKSKADIVDMLEKIDATTFNPMYAQAVESLRLKLTELATALQITDNDQGLLKEFSFSRQDAAALIDRVVKKSKRPAAILQTGIRQLNAILAPGFQSGRMYTILGGSGKFKSGTLLNIADQIRRFNPQIPAYENGLRKCILFITLENSIEETIERIYDMYSDLNEDLRDAETDEVLDTLREKGEFRFNESEGIDIFMKYAGNLEINTAQIHVYVKELREKGFTPICIILDYIKRIDSVHPSNGDERVRMSFVAKELKAIAQFYEIPMITAMQLNRDGNSIIDAAMRENKQDVARFVGSSSIGNAWDIIEDSDWVGLINLEMQKSTGKLFLTFKRLKIRGKSKMGDTIPYDYFNHPFENAKNIRLMTDVDKDESASIISLSTDLESIDEKENERFNALPTTPRPTLGELQDSSRGKVLRSLSDTLSSPIM